MKALQPTDVVIGGGNASKLKTLPPGSRLGDNANAFAGGFILWTGNDSIQLSSLPTHGAGRVAEEDSAVRFEAGGHDESSTEG